MGIIPPPHPRLSACCLSHEGCSWLSVSSMSVVSSTCAWSLGLGSWHWANAKPSTSQQQRRSCPCLMATWLVCAFERDVLGCSTLPSGSRCNPCPHWDRKRQKPPKIIQKWWFWAVGVQSTEWCANMGSQDFWIACGIRRVGSAGPHWYKSLRQTEFYCVAEDWCWWGDWAHCVPCPFFS